MPIKSMFWDIESYDNLFCVGMMDDDNHLEMHYLVDPKDKDDVIRALNDSGYDYTPYDLSQDASRLIWHFKKKRHHFTKNERTLLTDFLSKKDLTLDRDEEEDEDRYWYFGYNTATYDLPMIDYVLDNVMADAIRLSPKSLREHSDAIISGDQRQNLIGKYINQVDCALLNEKKVSGGRITVGLKTLVGVRGGSIIESESNKSGHSDNIYSDILYNINDVTELKDRVYPGLMEETFKIRENLLERFPHLAKHGLTVNSTSANFVAGIVSPDKPIDDTPVVSFTYPAKHVADRLGVPQTNVLEDTKNWYMENIYKRVKKNNPKAANKNLIQFMSIISLYKEVEGKNWNSSGRHYEKYHLPVHTKAERKALFDKWGTFLPLIDQYGNDTGTYVNFSLGGIHGAEIFKEQLDNDRAKIKELKDEYGLISKIPSGKVSLKLKNMIKFQSRTPYKNYPEGLLHEIPYLAKKTEPSDEIIDPEEFSPFVYNKNKGKEELDDRYVYTSVGNSVHQDFAGYYPMLMINLGVFYDGHGKDPYNEVYNHRLRVKKRLKTLEFGSEEYKRTDIEQLGYKLILNSASGVLDADFDTNLRANNKAMAMRSIGQMFTYRIAAALAIEGARIPSSNTDGIYVFDMDIDENTKIVDRELKKLYISIDPEKLFLISKDANNRAEIKNGQVTSARGASLTSWAGARVDNSLAHPAMVDRVMTYYLQMSDLKGDPDKEVVRQAISKYLEEAKPLAMFENFPDGKDRTLVYMASWLMRSTSGSIFITDHETIWPGTCRIWLTKTGEVFSRFSTGKTKPSKKLDSWAEKLPDSQFMGDPELIDYLLRLGILDKYFGNAITVEDYKAMRKQGSKESVSIVKQSKISSMPDGAKCQVNNASLFELSNEEIAKILHSLDWDAYVDMIADFAKSWHNKLATS